MLFYFIMLQRQQSKRPILNETMYKSNDPKSFQYQDNNYNNMTVNDQTKFHRNELYEVSRNEQNQNEEANYQNRQNYQYRQNEASFNKQQQQNINKQNGSNLRQPLIQGQEDQQEFHQKQKQRMPNGNQQILQKQQCKISIILLFVLSILGMGATVGALVISYLKNYIGLLVSNSSTFVCTAYLTLKLQYNLVNVLNVSFFGGALSLLATLLVIVQLLYLLIKFCKCQEHFFSDFTQATFIRLYIGYSIGILGIMLGTSYYLTYLIQEGVQCLNYISTDLIMLCALFGAAFLFLLICWIILLVFRLKTKKKFQANDEQKQYKQTQERRENYQTDDNIQAKQAVQENNTGQAYNQKQQQYQNMHEKEKNDSRKGKQNQYNNENHIQGAKQNENIKQNRSNPNDRELETEAQRQNNRDKISGITQRKNNDRKNTSPRNANNNNRTGNARNESQNRRNETGNGNRNSTTPFNENPKNDNRTGNARNESQNRRNETGNGNRNSTTPFNENPKNDNRTGNARNESQNRRNETGNGNRNSTTPFKEMQYQKNELYQGQNQNSSQDDGEKRSNQAPQKGSMVALFKQMQENNLNELKKQDMKQSLIEEASLSSQFDSSSSESLEQQIEEKQESEQQDNVNELNNEEKQYPKVQKKQPSKILEAVSYQDYIKKQQKQKRKEQKKQELIENLMKQIECKRKLKDQLKKQQQEERQRLRTSALSPDDPQFDKIFMEFDEEENKKKNNVKQEQNEEFYPANFVPTTKQEKKKFQAYKKRLLKKYKAQLKKPGVLRHPQNLTGGRSRKAVKKFMMQNKRPPRNQTTRLENIKEEPNNVDLSCLSSSESQQSSRSARFQMTDRSVKESKIQLATPSQPIQQQQMMGREPQQILYFSKEKIKIRQRKPLFTSREPQNNPINSVRRNIIQGSESQYRSSRLKQLRNQRIRNKPYQKQQLLDRIRSSYC